MGVGGHPPCLWGRGAPCPTQANRPQRGPFLKISRAGKRGWGPCAPPWCWKTAKWLEVGDMGGGRGADDWAAGRPSQYR